MGIVDRERLIQKRTAPEPDRSREWVIRVITDPGELEAEQAAWGELSKASAEPNVFYEPWFFSRHGRRWRLRERNGGSWSSNRP